MHQLSLSVCAVAAVMAGCGVDAPPVGPAQIEISRYDYAIDLTTAAATSSITFEVTSPGDCIAMPIRATLTGPVLFDGEEMLSGTVQDGLLQACGRGWDAGEQVVLTANLTVPQETWDSSQVGFSVTSDGEGAPFAYLVSWVGGCDRFGPCDSRADAFARYHFDVTHQPGVQVLCPGVLTPGDTLSSCDFDMDGGPTYSTFGIAASPSWTTHDLGSWGGTKVTLYDMPSAGFAGNVKTDQHAAFLAWMSETFGAYPYGSELRLIVGPTYWNGFEHPGNITLNDGLRRQVSAYADPLAHTINHELAHQWAGDQTTLASTLDFVWKEAMAEYFTFVFDEEQVSTLTSRATVKAWKSFSSAAEYHPVPEEAPELLYFYGDVYGPGPMVLFRQIEALSSREAVFAALKSLLGEPRAIGVADVQSALEQSTGLDLANYFESWVYGTGAPSWPKFDVIITDKPTGGVDVTVRQRSVEAGLYGCAFTIRLQGAGASYDVDFNLGPDGMAEKTIAAEPGFAVTGHIFDAKFETLATEATSTAAPSVRINPWVAPRRR